MHRCCKVVILDTLGKRCYAHPKWCYHFEENFRIYLQAWCQHDTPCFSGDIVKICKFLIFGTLSMSGYARPKWYYQLAENFDVSLHAWKKHNHHPSLRYCILKNHSSTYNSRTRSLTDIWLVVKYLLFTWDKDKNFLKNPKKPIFKSFWTLWGEMSFPGKRAL